MSLTLVTCMSSKHVSSKLTSVHCRNADTLKKLQETEKLLKDRTEAAYVNLDVSNEEREKGNQVGMCASLLHGLLA